MEIKFMMKNNNEEVQSIKKPFDYVGFKVGFSFVVVKDELL